MPRVSVLMTVYNAAPYLREAIDSLLAQTFPDWELVAVENGSKDASPAILARYTDPRIRVHALPQNIGRTPALRLAFEMARGEYMAVLDADDAALPTRFARQVEFLDAHPAVCLVGSWAEQINERSEVTGHFRPAGDPAALSDALGCGNPFIHSSIFYRADSARRAGGYPAEFVYAQDYALILEMEQRAPVAILPETLCRWRVVKTSMSFSWKHAVIIAREEFQLAQLAGRRAFHASCARRRARHELAVRQLRLGIFLVLNASPGQGMRHCLGAIIRSPSCLVSNGFARGAMRRLG
jgi:glycosyltransferase involved in cell wall biosynthesis